MKAEWSRLDFPRITYFLVILFFFISVVKADNTFDKLISSGKYKEAVDYADEKLTERTPEVWVQLGKANEALGMSEKALACYLVSWRMNPEDYNALVGAAKVYNTLNQPDNALNMAEKALQKNFTAEASWEYARACISLNRSAEAKKALEKVIQSDSSNVIANRELGQIYFNEKAWDKAIALLKKISKKEQNDQIAYKIGKAYLEKGAADSAVKYIKLAVSAGGNSEASVDLARAYFNQRNFKLAAEEFRKVPKGMLSAEDCYQMGICEEKNGDQAASVEFFEVAVNKFGASTATNALLSREKLGRARLKSESFNSALEQFQFIMKADQKALTVPDIYMLLSDAQLGAGQKDNAISTLEKAISLNEKNIEAYARLADLYQKSGLEDKARKTYETLLNLSPNDPQVYLALGQHSLKSQKYADALSNFEKSNTLRRSASASEGMAIAAFNLGKYDKAREAAKTAVSMDAGAWDARVLLATVLMKDNNYKAAQEHLEYMVRKESYKMEYLLQLATCYLQNGEKEKLSELDKRIVVLDKSNVESRLRLAHAADASNDIESALTYYKELSVLTPKVPDLFRRLSELSQKKGNMKEAVTFLSRYLDFVPDDAEARKDLGNLLYEQKDYDGALEAYRSAMKLNPAIKGFYKRYAEIVIAKGQHEEVITAFNRLISDGDADVNTYTTLGMIYQKKKSYTQAIQMYQKALQLEPSNVDALSALGSCQTANGDLAGAAISYEQAVMMNPSAIAELKELGEIYLRMGKEQEGIKVFKKYVEKDTADSEVVKVLGKKLFERKEYAEAARYLAYLGENASPDYLMMYSEACFNSGKFKDAAKVLESVKSGNKIKGTIIYQVYKMLAEAYEKDSNYIKASAAYGDYLTLPGVKDSDAAYKQAFYLENSDIEASQKLYEQNIKNYPADYRSFLRLGLIYSAKKESLQKAVTMFTRVTDLASSVPAVYLELGRVYGKMGKEDEQLYALRKYVESDPQNIEANKYIGIILTRKGQVNEGIVHLEMANALKPNDGETMENLGLGYIATGRNNEAIELLSKAKSINKENTNIRYQLFELFRKTGQNDKALKEMKDLLELSRETRYQMIYAEALLSSGKARDAEEVVEDILATEGENIDAFLLKAKILRSRKKYDDAIEVYKEIMLIVPEHAQTLYERAETHLQQSKLPWAETFYTRALRADPKMALAQLGLAKVAKARKNMTEYKKYLELARQMEPQNQLILQELKESEAK
jgi:tetratricopeptide (TPR) repeat protein